MQAHLVLGPAEGETVGVSGREEAGDAVTARTGAGEQGVEVRLAAMGDPRLGAGDPIAVGALSARQVRAAASDPACGSDRL
ncbi:hypothetical protein GCM10017744_084090 [Streptomyces antimycoticus]|uniref:Uncharacterized protein n=1 Tax=Streptomyces antimycoticus TaxID=68175 RepID=A0A4D4JY68_9ACTN|nr:hypothetical protein SANT12839_017260 [Streptomyces antimycoticus]